MKVNQTLWLYSTNLILLPKRDSGWNEYFQRSISKISLYKKKIFGDAGRVDLDSVDILNKSEQI